MPPTILVACDSGDRAPRAFAQGLAPLLEARVLHVNVRASTGLADEEPDAGNAATARRDLRVERASSPAAGLQRLIASERPVLTVLGSAHGGAYGRVRIGTTAERILHGAPSPVAVVPRGFDERPLRSIAVGLLPGADSLRALHAAAALARAAAATLVVVAVLRRSPSPADAAAFAAAFAPSFTLSGPPSRILHSAITAAAQRSTATPLTVLADAPGPAEVQPRVLIGDPADALLRLSGRVGLLVLGSRGYGPGGVVIPGGVARRVFGQAACPVLLIPRAEVTAPVLVPA